MNALLLAIVLVLLPGHAAGREVKQSPGPGWILLASGASTTSQHVRVADAPDELLIELTIINRGRPMWSNIAASIDGVGIVGFGENHGSPQTVVASGQIATIRGADLTVDLVVTEAEGTDFEYGWAVLGRNVQIIDPLDTAQVRTRYGVQSGTTGHWADPTNAQTLPGSWTYNRLLTLVASWQLSPIVSGSMEMILGISMGVIALATAIKLINRGGPGTGGSVGGGYGMD